MRLPNTWVLPLSWALAVLTLVTAGRWRPAADAAALGFGVSAFLLAARRPAVRPVVPTLAFLVGALGGGAVVIAVWQDPEVSRAVVRSCLSHVPLFGLLMAYLFTAGQRSLVALGDPRVGAASDTERLAAAEWLNRWTPQPERRNVRLWVTHLQLLVRSGRCGDAVEVFRTSAKAHRDAPEAPEALDLAADACRHAYDPMQARAALLDEVLSAYPGSQLACHAAGLRDHPPS